MKYKVVSILSALSMLILSASCGMVEEFVQDPLQSTKHFFSVDAELPEMEQETDTKGYLGSFVAASWTAGDKLSVINLTTGNILVGSLTADSNGNRSTFSGEVTGSINEGDQLALLYPAIEVSQETSFGQRPIDLSAQTKEAKVPLVACTKFTAGAEGGEFTGLSLSFYYMLSYLKINMANLPAGAKVSKVTLRNLPSEMTLTVNADASTGFNIGTSEEMAASSKIELEGAYETKETGALSVSVAVMPSDQSDLRGILVTVDGDGEYLSPLTSAKLASHKYYNTVASQFEKVGIADEQSYGAYNVKTGAALDVYKEYQSTIISGVEGTESDFSLLDVSNMHYWTLKGMPSEPAEGDTFSAHIYTYGIYGLTNDETVDEASVKMSEPDGDYTKLRVRAGDYLFIVRK